MVDILDHLQKYAPDNKTPALVELYGDQLSCEGANDVIAARTNEDSPMDKLQGFHPSTQEWHKRLLLLEVM